TAASAALIHDDLSADVVIAHSPSAENHDQRGSGRLRMILSRYPVLGAAAQVAERIAANREAAGSVEVELVGETDESGRRRVSDPRFGSSALGRSNVASWGGLGLVCGAIAGLSGGDGVVGFISGGLVTAIVWGLLGLGAGAFYGLGAGIFISARRLKPMGGLLARGPSTLLAWTDGPLSDESSAILDNSPGTQRLVLGFEPTAVGAILEL